MTKTMKKPKKVSDPLQEWVHIIVLAILAVFMVCGQLEEVKYQTVTHDDYVRQLAIIVTDNGVNAPYRTLCGNCTATADIYLDNVLLYTINMTQVGQPGVFGFQADNRFTIDRIYEMRANVTSPDFGSEIVTSQFIKTPQAGAQTVVPSAGAPAMETQTDPTTLPECKIPPKSDSALDNVWTALTYFFTPSGIKCFTAMIKTAFVDAVSLIPGIGSLVDLGKGIADFFKINIIDNVKEVITDLITILFTDENALIKTPSGFLANLVIPWLARFFWSFLEATVGFSMLVEIVIIGYVTMTYKDGISMIAKTIEYNGKALIIIVKTMMALVDIVQKGIQSLVQLIRG